jgi:hypothetical protein
MSKRARTNTEKYILPECLDIATACNGNSCKITTINNTIINNVKYKDIKIKKIEFKINNDEKNEPKLKYDVLNNLHNLLLIQEKLMTQLLSPNTRNKVKANYFINNKETLDSWLKFIMLHHLKYHVFTRLARGEFGVGIQAVKLIPKDTLIFKTTASDCLTYHPVTLTVSEVAEIDKGTKSILDDFYLSLSDVEDKIAYPIPLLSPNAIDMSFFLNHDCNGNIVMDDSNDSCDMSSYKAKTDISKDCFLTINYAEFGKIGNDYDQNKMENLLKRMTFLIGIEPFKKEYFNSVPEFKDVATFNTFVANINSCTVKVNSCKPLKITITKNN